MRRRGRSPWVWAAVAPLLICTLALPVLAHPLGNFTVNRYLRVEVSGPVLHMLYVVDMAEIPAFQVRREVDADAEAYARRTAAAIVDGLLVEVDRRVVTMTPGAHTLERPMGQGGLPTLRLAVALSTPLGSGDRHFVRVVDGNEPERLGWREAIVVAKGEARVIRSSVPAVDITDELRSYPENLTSRPLDVREATFEFVAGPADAGPPSLTGSGGAPKPPGGLAALVNRRISVTGVTIAVLLAIGFGAVHALGPGHGKTVMAAYLTGERRTPAAALALGGIVASMHTIAVLVLGGILIALDLSIRPERIYPWFTLGAGVAVIGVGVWLLARHLRARRHRGDHDLLHSDPLSAKGLVALGTSGGLFPSPAAVIVLLSAWSLGRLALGIALVAAFSFGVALALGTIGILVVYGRRVVDRPGLQRLAALLPVVGAVALMALGVVAVVRGAVDL